MTIAQPPNTAIAVCAGLVALRRIAKPVGTAGAVIDAVAGTALVWWAIDEMARGVNPWRRLLGATALAGATLALRSKIGSGSAGHLSL